jgi:uncharacterized protein DUF6293
MYNTENDYTILKIRINMSTGGKIAHIVPMGLEVDRVLGGLKEFPTNKVILLYGTDMSSDIERRARSNGTRIKEMVKATIDVIEMDLDIFDFYSATRTLKKLLQDMRDDGFEVYVNLSTGNRIITSAALLVCFMTRSHPYYVRPEKYSIPEDREVLSHGVTSVIEIPCVTIMGPTKDEEELLIALGRLGGNARHETSLIPQLESVKGFFKPKKEGESKRSYLARKRAHLSRYLKTLEKEGYISLVKKGRYVNVSLTETGMLFSGPTEEEKKE